MTILIKNVQIIDGTGKPAYKADILIKNDKIAAIEPVIRYHADNIIDGRGACLAPGFIDIHNLSDHYLNIFSNPSQEHFLRQGITTIIGGHGGISLAPLIYGSLQTFRVSADVGKINIDWHSLKEFFNSMNKRLLSVNFGTLLGHTTVRRALIGKPEFRDLTPGELKILNSISEKNFKEGSFGISIGLDNPKVSNTNYFEIKKLAEITARFKGIFSVNLKNNKEDLIESVKRFVFLSRETGAKILLANFLPIMEFENNYQEALKLLGGNSFAGKIFYSIYPFEENVVWLGSLLPEWAKESVREKILENLQSPEIRKKILSELPKYKPEDITIISAPHHDYLVGKTLKNFFQNRNFDAKNGLLQLMEITRLRAEISIKNLNLDILINSLQDENAVISSGGVSAINSCNVFQKFLEIVAKEKIMPIEIAVRKITSLPAQKLGIHDRGEIKTGNFADLVIFNENEIKDVIINGKIAVQNGLFQNIYNGKTLKHNIS